jgi:hypothetical protein
MEEAECEPHKKWGSLTHPPGEAEEAEIDRLWQDTRHCLPWGLENKGNVCR